MAFVATIYLATSVHLSFNMQLHQLRYFITLVEKHSFTEAANECYITQSALSQQIKALEKELGVLLLKRKGRTFTISPAGMLLYKRSLSIVSEIDKLAVQVQRVHHNLGSTLRLGLLSSMDKNNFPENLKEQVLNRTGYELTLLYGSHDELYDLFGTGCLNAFISYENRLSATESFSKTKLFATKVYAEIPRNIEIPAYSSSKLKIDVAELSKFKLVMVCEDEYLLEEQQYLNTLFNNANITCEATSSIAEGRKIILQQPHSALIVDRSLMRGDLSTHSKLFRYEVIQEGKSVKRPLCCFARKNFGSDELQELCRIIMELGQKKASFEEFNAYSESVAEPNDRLPLYHKHNLPI